MSTVAARVAVVTGGASGIGEATCHELGRLGHQVAVLDVNEQAAQRVAEDLRAQGVPSIGVGTDVTDRAGVEQAFAKVRSELGPTLVLVTSAGMFGFAPFIEITVESWAPGPTSPQRPGFCARIKRLSSPARCSASTAER